MIKVDAIRHYLSRPRIIIEGFLGQQNPMLAIGRTSTTSVQMSITGELSSVRMYSPGQFGIDIYLPFSVLPEVHAALIACGITPAQTRDFQVFDPAGTERGPKRVPSILANRGRVSYSMSSSVWNGSLWCSRGGSVYIDIETHDKDDHKTWTRNPVMEPFELHFGIRGTAAKLDPFLECDQVPGQDLTHVTSFSLNQAAELLGRLDILTQDSDYAMTPIDGDTWNFDLTLHGRVHRICKVYSST